MRKLFKSAINSIAIVLATALSIGVVDHVHGQCNAYLGAKSPICANQTSPLTLQGAINTNSYQLYLNGNLIGTSKTPSNNIVQWDVGPGSYTVVGSGTTCNGSVYGPVVVSLTTGRNVTISNSGSSAICAGTSITLTPGSGQSYQWSSSPNDPNATGSGAITVHPTQSTTYTLYGNEITCKQPTSTSLYVSVGTKTGNVSSLTGNGSPIQGQQSTTYTAAVAGAGGYGWSITPAGAAAITNQTVNGNMYTATVNWDAAFYGGASVKFTATSGNYCSYTSNQTMPVNVYQLPVPPAPVGTTNTCGAKTITIALPPVSANATYYLQTSANGQSTSVPLGTSYTFTSSGSYWINCRLNNPVMGSYVWSKSTPVSVAAATVDPTDLTVSAYDKSNPLIQATHSIRLLPGFNTTGGGTLDAKIAVTPECNDQMNWKQQIGYDMNGQPVANSRVYLDGFGNTLQNQSIDYLNNKLWVNQPLYDNLNQAVATTLPAPIVETDFLYKSTFVQNGSGQIYSASDFDKAISSGAAGEVNNPNPVSSAVETVGWYYSSSNNLETQTPTTSYPYARTYTPAGPDPVTSKSASPGNPYKMGSGHESKSDRYLIASGELTHYYALQHFFVTSTLTQGLGYKYVSTDANGKQAVTFVDAGGRTLATALVTNVNTSTTPATVTCDAATWSYTYYTDLGQVVASVAPAGVNVGSTAMPGYVTTYQYDQVGQLIGTTSPDEGTSQYVYSTDGKIRFSQNQVQANATPKRFSYTHYDNLGRLIESGEYTQGNYVFEPMSTTTPAANSVLNIVDTQGYSDAANNLESAACSDVNKIYYDAQAADFVGDANHTAQAYLYGQVAKTANTNATTWYSYDEFGQLAWTIQNIAGLGTKTIDYTYDYYGNVVQVTYQKGQIDQFMHYYTYDKNQRLVQVQTSPDGTTKTTQAAYYYYLHGPLKRVELGGNVQGIDYVYNIDGSLKLINHPDPALDPGGDGLSGTHSSFQKDVFGMALDYNSSDYAGAGFNAGSFSAGAGYSDQFGGTVKSMRWHSQADSHVPRAYAYTYDNLYQLKSADWGSVTGSNNTYAFTKSGTSAYQESIGSYDNNGNIQTLSRKNNLGSSIANYTYNYSSSGPNQLTSVKDGNNPLLSYQYNATGQMTQQTEQLTGGGSKTMNVAYNAYGMVKTISDANNNLMVKYDYDDRGNRVKKTSYTSGTISHVTYYVSDAGGNVLSIYEQDVANSGPLLLTELGIYGAGRVATYKPVESTTFYEVTDHLGNVRGVIGKAATDAPVATYENENGTYEQGQFLRYATARRVNSTLFDHTYDGQTPPNGTAYAERLSGGANEVYGLARSLSVNPGDVVKMEVYTKYVDPVTNNWTGILPGLMTQIASAAAGVVVDGSGYVTSTQTFPYAGLLTPTGNSGVPDACLNWVLFDRNFKQTGGGSACMTGTAKENGSNVPHEKLAPADVTITDPGYMYVYLSNEGTPAEVYFDDFKVTQIHSNVVAGADYYPFGLVMSTREITQEPYRYGYQGQFAEKDNDTGYNSFELRQYDARTGRWISGDPYGQYNSPYLGMGNNPANGVDPSGGLFGVGWSDFKAFLFGGNWEVGRSWGWTPGLFNNLGNVAIGVGDLLGQPPVWSSLTKQVLSSYVQNKECQNCSSGQLEERTGRRFEEAWNNYASRNLLPADNYQRNQNKYNGNGRNVIPDGKGDAISISWTGKKRTFREAAWYEVKAKNGNIYNSTSSGQIRGHIDAMSSRYQAAIAAHAANLNFITTSEVSLSPTMTAYAKTNGIAVNHWVAKYRMVHGKMQIMFAVRGLAGDLLNPMHVPTGL